MLHVTPLLAALSGAPVPDAAVAAGKASPPPPERVLETTFASGIGLTGGPALGGMTVSLLLTHSFDLLALGIESDLTFITSQLYGTGLLAGLHFGGDVSFRVLAAGGVHHYENVGRDLLSDDPGVSGTVPYVGCRWLLGFRIKVSNARRRPFLGLLAGADYDLFRENKAVTYDGDFDGLADSTSTHQLGQLGYSGQFLAGWEFDLAPY